MKLPNAELAVVDIRKLRDYCLNPLHEEGKHKARLFMAALGMTIADAEALQSILLQAVYTTEVKVGRGDTYGQRYIMDFFLTWRGKQERIRSGWIIEYGSPVPRLTTCYLL